MYKITLSSILSRHFIKVNAVFNWEGAEAFFRGKNRLKECIRCLLNYKI